MHKYQPKIHIQPLGKEYDGLDHGRRILFMGLDIHFLLGKDFEYLRIKYILVVFQMP